MKKLTAGIFATLLAVVSVGAAHAEIASKGYVDQQVGTKADATTVTSLQGTVSEHTTQIAGKADKATTLAGYGITDGATKTELTSGLAGKVDDADIADMQVKANLTTTLSGTSTDAQYPSAKAVYDTIQAKTSDIASNETVEQIQTDLETAEGEIDALQTGKQDKNMGAGAANHVVITDETGNITSAATIAAAKVSGLANVAKTGAYGDLTGTPSLGTLASKSTITSDDITNGTIAEADLNTTINASLDKADAAVQPSDIANMQTTTKLTKSAGWEGAKTSDDNYPSNAAVNAAITSATSGLATDSKMGDLSSLTTTVQTNLVGAINEVDANADAAKTAADAAQEAAETAQTTAEARIPKPSGECSNPTAKCVLVSNGTNSFEWEVIARDGEGA